MSENYSKRINLIDEPGLFSTNEHKKLLLQNFLSSESLRTPPRGNLDGIVLIGYMPGKMKYYPGEQVFMYGPTSKFLKECLKEIGYFPYFTNLFKNHDWSLEKSLKFLKKELKIINPKKIILLGKYPEFNFIKNFGYNFNQINHPSWALRFNKRKEFCNQLKGALNEKSKRY